MNNKEFINYIALIKNCFENLNFAMEDFVDYSTDEKYDSIIVYSGCSQFNDTEAFFKKAYLLLENGGIIAIAHVESKENVNRRYNSIKRKIETTCKTMNKFGFKTIRSQDDYEYYICIGEKV